MRTLVLVTLVACVALPTAMAQSDDPVEIPGSLQVLIQSELDYLDAAGRRIDLDLRGVLPKHALQTIGKKAGVRIEILGELPRTPKLSADFAGATVKEILTWYAREVPVVYRAERRDTLAVHCRSKDAALEEAATLPAVAAPEPTILWPAP